jgi:hypothetical protein
LKKRRSTRCNTKFVCLGADATAILIATPSTLGARAAAFNNASRGHVRVDGEADLNAVCYALRGLFAANGNSDGQSKSNQQFRRGVVVTFGSGPLAGLFLDSVEQVIRKRVRNRIQFDRR